MFSMQALPSWQAKECTSDLVFCVLKNAPTFLKSGNEVDDPLKKYITKSKQANVFSLHICPVKYI